MMWRRTRQFVAICFSSIVISGCGILARQIDARTNSVASPSPYQPSVEATKLHSTLVLADMHSDALISTRDLLERANFGHLDIPRLAEAKVRIQTFTQPTFSALCLANDDCGSFPNLIGAWAVVSQWPLATWFSQQKRALFYSSRLAAFVERSRGNVVLVTSAPELRTFLDQNNSRPRLAAILGVEGSEVLEGDLGFVPQLAAVGYRIFGLAHQADNEAAGSSQGRGKGGLTPFGYQVVAAADRSGMIVDLAHASGLTIDDVSKLRLRAPPVDSHTGLVSVCKQARNIGDEQVKEIVRAGGIIGIGFWDVVLCMRSGDDAQAFAERVAQTMMRVVDLTREIVPAEAFDHVALGSDFDGSVYEGFDASGLVLVTDALLHAGFGEPEIRKIMGGNYCRYLLKYLPGRRVSDGGPESTDDSDGRLCMSSEQFGRIVPL